MNATVTPIRRKSDSARLISSKNSGVNSRRGVVKNPPAIPADAAATAVTVAMMTSDAMTLSVRHWADPDHAICEAHCDVTNFADALVHVAGVTEPEHQYFGVLTTRADGVETTHRLHLAVQQVETATATRLLLTLAAYDTRAMVWVAAVDTAILEG